VETLESTSVQVLLLW